MAPKKAAASQSTGSRKSTRESKQTSNPTAKSSITASTKTNTKTNTNTRTKSQDASSKRAIAAQKKRKASEKDQEKGEDEERDELEGGIKENKGKSQASSDSHSHSSPPTLKKEPSTVPTKSKEVSSSSSTPPAGDQLSGYNFVFCGKLASLTTEEASNRCKAQGARVSKTVDLDTTHAVLGKSVSRVQMNAIEWWDVETMGEKEFLKLVGIESLQKKSSTVSTKSKKASLSSSPLVVGDQLSSYTFVFCGKLASLTTKEASKRCEAQGARVSETINLDTTHAVLGKSVGLVQMNAIEWWDVETMGEEGFLKLVGLNPEAPAPPGQEETDGENPEQGSSKEKASPRKFKAVDQSSLLKSSQTSLKGLTVVFTGALSMKRDEAKALAEAHGAKVVKSVSGKTDLVVLGSACGPKKLVDIESKGIQTTDESGFLRLARSENGGVASASASASGT